MNRFIPASFFGAVIGLAALGLGWRVAARAWALPPVIAEAICAVATAIWLLLLVQYARKWIVARAEAMAEVEHPVQCCFIALIFTASLLIAGVLAPYSEMLAKLLYIVSAVAAGLFVAWRHGGLWRGGRDISTTTSVLYLPTVGAPLVACGIGGGVFGWHDLACFFFGTGVLSWLALESVILNRLLNGPPLAAPLRPTLGIQLAPPAVTCGAYLSISHGAPDLLALSLFGYAVLQAVLLLRLLPWIAEAGVSMGFWGFSFGVSALGADAARFADRGAGGAWGWIAPMTFALANLIILLLVLNSVRLFVRGRAMPPPLLQPAPVA
jgi:tellurite resistance protein